MRESQGTTGSGLPNVSRRAMLALSGAGLAGVAGCLGDDTNGDDDSDDGDLPADDTGDDADDLSDLDQVQFTFASENPADDVAGQAAYLFKEKVEEESDGSIIVDVVPGGAFGTAGELMELVGEGSVEATYATDSYFVFAQEHNFPNHPWLFTTVEQTYEGWDLVWDHLVESNVESGNIRPFGGPFYLGNRHVCSNVRFTSPEESEGLNLRAPPLHPWEELLIQAFNANTEPVALSETYTSIDTGVVDAAELPLSDLVGNSLHEVTDYLIMTGHSAYGTTFEINDDFFQGLDSTHQEILVDMADEIQPEVEQKARDFEEEAVDIFADEGGAEIVEVDRDPFLDGALPVLEHEFTDPDGVWYESEIEWDEILEIIQ